MLITRKSLLTGTERTLDLPISEKHMATFKAGALVQDAFPHLNDDQREFILTGITDEEWDDVFGGEDDDDFENEGAF